MKDNLQQVSRDYELMKVKYLQNQNNKKSICIVVAMQMLLLLPYSNNSIRLNYTIRVVKNQH